jgi:hypothetical protein
MLYGTFYTVRDHANGIEWDKEFRTLQEAQDAIKRSGLKHNISPDENYRDSHNVVNFRRCHKAE